MTILDFATKHDITIMSDRVDENPNMDSPAMNHYRVILSQGGSVLVTIFSMGLGLTGPPQLQDVLGCLRVDALLSFEEWAEGFGFDTDSRKAEKTYLACRSQRARLQAFLGEHFEELMECEE